MSTNKTHGAAEREFPLGEFEHMVLLATLRLRDEAYGPTISRELERQAGRSVSRGALYSALGRLEEKGFVNWQLEQPGPDRGGHAKRRFQLTPTGLAAVRTYRKALLRLWSSLDDVLGSERG